MDRRRVLISGMGGDLGSRVAVALEHEDWVGEIVGYDSDPARRRLSRSTFHLVDHGDAERVGELVAAFDPHVYIHLAVWEPASRAAPRQAEALTHRATTVSLGAAATCPSLEAIVLRSGIEVYGRGRGAPRRPDEDDALAPTCQFGRMLAELERTAREVAATVGVPVAAMRLGPVLGPHVPSPLGRLLRQPLVPFNPLADPPFAVVEDTLSARAFVAAARRRLDGPVNVVANGAITARQAACRGKRVPLPLVGPQWLVARTVSELTGAPIPDHVREMLSRGRLASNRRMPELLGFAADISTVNVVDKVYAWPSVIRQPAQRPVA